MKQLESVKEAKRLLLMRAELLHPSTRRKQRRGKAKLKRLGAGNVEVRNYEP